MEKMIYLGYILALLPMYKFNVYTVVAALGFGACLWYTASKEDDWVSKQHTQHILQIAAKMSVVMGLIKLGIDKTMSVFPIPFEDFCSLMGGDRSVILEQYPDDAWLYICAFYLLGAILLFGFCLLIIATWGTLRQLRSIHKEGIRKSLDYRYPFFENKKKSYFEDESR